jgi:hypothetical protein
MRKQVPNAILILALSLFTSPPMHASTRSAESRSDRSAVSVREPGDRDWYRRLPRIVRRLVVSIQEQLVIPRP